MPGAKDGQYKFVQEAGGGVNAYTWSMNEWKVGATAFILQNALLFISSARFIGLCMLHILRACCLQFKLP